MERIEGARRRLSVACLAVGLALLAFPASGLLVRDVEIAWNEELPVDPEAWTSTTFSEIPDEPRPVWIRAKLDLGDDPSEIGRPLAIRLDALATCSIRWDGELLAELGRVGATRVEEVPGPIAQVHALPDRLAGPGLHELLLRCSTHHRKFVPSVGFWALQVGPYRPLLEAGNRGQLLSIFSLSGMLLVGGYFLVLYLLDRRDRTELLLALFALVGAALLVVESLRRLVDYGYGWHVYRLVAIAVLAWLLNVLLVAFLVERFPGRRSRGDGRPGSGRRWIVVVALLAAVPLVAFAAFDAKSTATFVVGLPVGLAWALAAIRRRQAGAGLAFAGVALCLGALLLDPTAFVDRTLYPMLDGLLLFLLVAHARRVRAVREEREEARLQAARLEAELLRRHLQPHFLMNTLTALSEWIEEDPSTAVEMIEALAGELRVLGDLSAESLVTMEQELRLCRSHLEVMAHRQEIDVRLETRDVDPEATIPPAVFHTLVENALTHGDPNRREMRLKLEEVRRDGRRVYTFRAPAHRAASARSVEEGGGLGYVRARLREAYGDGWNLCHGPEDGAWLTEIDLPAEPR